MALGAPAHAALAQMGIVTPTEIQTAAIPPLLAGRDLLGEAPTGSGKTLAFALPLSERLDASRRQVQGLVLVPTRELAVQVEQVFAALGRHYGFRTVVICGGRSPSSQVRALQAGAQVVVGTPGRVLDLIRQGALALQGLRFLVLDEADEMLDRGFAPDVERILARAPARRQTALFSATMPDWVRTTAERHLRAPATARVARTPASAPAIEHQVYEVPAGQRWPALQALLNARGAGMTLVFGRTKHGVKQMARRLDALGYPVAALQGNLSQNARDRVMDDVRRGKVPILIATNVAARGIDVDHIEQVINYELPESPELFTHRVGRTGRMGRSGVAVTLLEPTDLPRWVAFERALGRRLPRAAWPGGRAAAAPPPRAPAAPATAAQVRSPAAPTAVAQARLPATPATTARRQPDAGPSRPVPRRPAAPTPPVLRPASVPASPAQTRTSTAPSPAPGRSTGGHHATSRHAAPSVSDPTPRAASAPATPPAGTRPGAPPSGGGPYRGRRRRPFRGRPGPTAGSRSAGGR
jgi:ATP-dependent RNA helicase DeaD